MLCLVVFINYVVSPPEGFIKTITRLLNHGQDVLYNLALFGYDLIEEMTLLKTLSVLDNLITLGNLSPVRPAKEKQKPCHTIQKRMFFSNKIFNQENILTNKVMDFRWNSSLTLFCNLWKVFCCYLKKE